MRGNFTEKLETHILISVLYFSSFRLQVQERVTKQVASALMEILQPQGVAVIMEATHLCMCMR